MNDQERVRPHVVAILDTMWGDPNAISADQEYPPTAPSYFTISQGNHSGKRLYDLVGNARLTVTNSCKELVYSAKDHGKPDPVWLAANLGIIAQMRPIIVLLVCGKVAQQTYSTCGYDPGAALVVNMPHPAARFIWTAELTATIQAQIHDACMGTATHPDSHRSSTDESENSSLADLGEK